jgi:hypothetical protein
LNASVSGAAKAILTFCFIAVVIISVVVALDGGRKVCAGEEQVSRGSASGSVKIDGKPINLKYAYAVAQPNMIEKQKTDIAVLLTEKPLPDGALKGVENLWDVAAKNLRGWLCFKIDEAGKPISETVDHPSG